MRRLAFFTLTGASAHSRLRRVVAVRLSGNHDTLREGSALGIVVAHRDLGMDRGGRCTGGPALSHLHRAGRHHRLHDCALPAQRRVRRRSRVGRPLCGARTESAMRRLPEAAAKARRTGMVE
jgi:hypothetical protein